MGRSSVSEEVRVAQDEAVQTDPERKRLDDARAEFRAAWQAKADRVSRYREWAAKADTLSQWVATTTMLILFLFVWAVVNSLSRDTFQFRHFRSSLFGVLGCVLVQYITVWASALISWCADRLEVAEVNYGRPSRERAA